MIGRLARTALISLALSSAAHAQSANDDLLVAINNRDARAVGAALTMGADPNYLDPELTTTPLVIALGSRQSAIALLLLAKGADPKAELADGAQHIPAMILAVKCDDPAVIAAMIDHGGDAAATDSYGNTALTEAASDGRGDMVQALLGKGVDPNQADGRNRTALMWAIKTTNLPLVNLLLAHGAHANLAVDGVTPLQAAKSKGNADIVAALRKAGAK